MALPDALPSGHRCLRPRRSARTGLGGIGTAWNPTDWSAGEARRAGRLPGLDPTARAVPRSASEVQTYHWRVPIAIPNPYPTDDGGFPRDADSWLLIWGRWVGLNAVQAVATPWRHGFDATTLTIAISAVETTLTGFAGWAGPGGAEVVDIPTGGSVLAEWRNPATGAVIASTTLSGAGTQVASFPAEDADGPRQLRLTFTGGTPTAWRLYDFGPFYRTCLTVPGSVISGFTERAANDLFHGVQGFENPSLLNIATNHFARGGLGLGTGWPNPKWTPPEETPSTLCLISELPDAQCQAIWTGERLDYNTLAPYAYGPVVDSLVLSGGTALDSATAAGTYNTYSYTAVRGDVSNVRLRLDWGAYGLGAGFTGTMTVTVSRHADWRLTGGLTTLISSTALAFGLGQEIDLGGFAISAANYEVYLRVDVDLAVGHTVPAPGTDQFLFSLVTIFSRKPIPVQFSWADTLGGHHLGGYDPARVRAPTGSANAANARFYEAPLGDTSYAVPGGGLLGPGASPCVVAFRPTAGPKLYAVTQPPYSARAVGEYERLPPIAMDYYLCHGDGRRFFAWVGSQNTPATLALEEVSPLVTEIPVAGLTTAYATHLTTVRGSQVPNYIFMKVSGLAANTYKVWVTGAGVPANDSGTWMGMSAELALSVTDQLCTDGDPARFVHDYVDPLAAAPANTPPGSPVEGTIYLIGSAPTGAWADQANGYAQWRDATSTISPTSGWIFYAPELDQRFGAYLAGEAGWESCATKQVAATIAVAAGQTLYVRLSGQHPAIENSYVPIGVTVRWAAA